jgi:PPOX class F420-dependent enzyme/OxyR family protein
MAELTASQIDYLTGQRLGRLATAGADHKPHVVPTSFRYNADLGTIDVGGQHVHTTKKYRDVQQSGWAAIVIDDLMSINPWQPRMPGIRGRDQPRRRSAAASVQVSAVPSSAFIRRRATASESTSPLPGRDTYPHYGRTMRAVVYERTGDPEVLTLIDKPRSDPGSGEMRVRIVRSGVNPTDWKSRRGSAMAEPVIPPQTPNQDGSV